MMTMMSALANLLFHLKMQLFDHLIIDRHEIFDSHVKREGVPHFYVGICCEALL